MIPLRGEGSAQPGPRRRAAPGVPTSFVVRQGDGERRANAIRALDRWLAACDVEVTLKQYHPKHSDAQRALFWSWCEHVAAFMRDAGQRCTREAVHDVFLIATFGGEDTGFGRLRPLRTLTAPRRMSKVEMMETLNRFEAWAAEFGCMVPRPESWEQDLAEARAEAARSKKAAA